MPRIIFVITALSLAGCHSAVQITTRPEDATVSRNDQAVCFTPCEVESRLPWFVGSMPLTIQKRGYQPKRIEVRRNDIYVARVILFPFFWPWAAGLEPQRAVELTPFPAEKETRNTPPLRISP